MRASLLFLHFWYHGHWTSNFPPLRLISLYFHLSLLCIIKIKTTPSCSISVPLYSKDIIRPRILNINNETHGISLCLSLSSYVFHAFPLFLFLSLFLVFLSLCQSACLSLSLPLSLSLSLSLSHWRSDLKSAWMYFFSFGLANCKPSIVLVLTY